jgi:hypothetical protein
MVNLPRIVRMNCFGIVLGFISIGLPLYCASETPDKNSDDCGDAYNSLARSQREIIGEALRAVEASKKATDSSKAESDFLDDLLNAQSPHEPNRPKSQREIIGEALRIVEASRKESDASKTERNFLDELLAKQTPPTTTPQPVAPYDPNGPVNPRNFSLASGSDQTVNPYQTKLVPWLGAGGRFGYNPNELPKGADWQRYDRAIPNSFSSADSIPLYFGHLGRVPRIEGFWDALRDGKIEVLAIHEGRLHPSGKFEAPVGVFRDPARQEYALIQAGNYQFLPIDTQPLLASEGRLILHRGVYNQTTVTIPTVSNNDPGKNTYQTYRGLRNWFVQSHTDLAFSFPYAGSGRAETNHVTLAHKSLIKTLREFDTFATPWVKSPYAQSARSALKVLPDNDGNRYTPDRNIAALRFGPNVLTISTPVTNVRFTSEWNSEKEFQLIEVENMEPVTDTVKVTYSTLQIALPAEAKTSTPSKVKVRVNARGEEYQDLGN